MWVTKRTDYATRVLLVLAMDESGRLLTLRDLARRTSTPRSTVEQVMSRLRDGGLVRAERGALGGYRLNCDPAEITIDEVVRLFQGEVVPLDCTDPHEPPRCEMAPGCSLRGLWAEAQAAVHRVLADVTVAELAERASGAWQPVHIAGRDDR